MDLARRARRAGFSIERLKTTYITAMKTILTLAAVVCLASCVSTTTTTTLPDGTVTVIEQRGIDQASVAAASDIGRRIIPTK